MNRVLAAAAALLLCAPALAAATPAVPLPAAAEPSLSSGVLPGYWEYSAKWTVVPVLKERRCLTAEKIEAFLFNPCTRHYRCSYPTKTVKDGQVRLDGTWTDKRARQAKVRAEGRYTPTTVDMKANVRTIHGIPLSGSFSAKRVGDTCPAGAQGA